MRELNYNQIQNEIRDIANSTLNINGKTLGIKLSEELDSVDRLSLIVAIEDHFGIAFEPSEDSLINTLDDLIKLILAGKKNIDDTTTPKFNHSA